MNLTNLNFENTFWNGHCRLTARLSFQVSENNLIKRKAISGHRSRLGHRVARWVCFQTKNTNLGKFWRAMQWKMLVYFMAIWYILWPFGIFCVHFVYFMVIWYIFPRFGTLYQEKSGNPAWSCSINSCPHYYRFRNMGPQYLFFVDIHTRYWLKISTSKLCTTATRYVCRQQ
jgi:hypothetical protein